MDRQQMREAVSEAMARSRSGEQSLLTVMGWLYTRAYRQGRQSVTDEMDAKYRQLMGQEQK